MLLLFGPLGWGNQSHSKISCSTIIRVNPHANATKPEILPIEISARSLHIFSSTNDSGYHRERMLHLPTTWLSKELSALIIEEHNFSKIL